MRALRVIDQANCIGCTKCIQACPVDAIVGATRAMHTVVAGICAPAVTSAWPPARRNVLSCARLDDYQKAGSRSLKPFRFAIFLWNNMLKLFSAFRKEKIWDFDRIHHARDEKPVQRHAAASNSAGDPFRMPLKQPHWR